MKRAIQHYEELIQEADAHLSVARNKRVPMQTAEITLYVNGSIIRAQERSHNLYASIDLVVNKLSRQLRRYKERHTDHHHSHGHSASPTKATKSLANESFVNDSLIEGKEVHLPDPGIRRKYFPMPPMQLEEARKQLDLIDHEFYLFREKKTNELQVIYKRKNGGYGVIQSKD